MSKRYERMSKEEILAEIANQDLSPACMTLYAWLTTEIKTKKVHRCELIKTPEDVDRLYKEYEYVCGMIGGNCKECPYYDKNDTSSAACFRDFLKEEIEVEE